MAQEGGHQHNILRTMPIDNVAGREVYYGRYHIRAYNSMLSQGVARYFMYLLNDGGFWRGNYDLMQPDGSIAPNQIIFSNMAWHIDGKKL